MSHVVPPPSTLSLDQACRSYFCSLAAHRCAVKDCNRHRLHFPPMVLCVVHLECASERYVAAVKREIVLCDMCEGVSADGKALCATCRASVPPHHVAAIERDRTLAVALLYGTPVKREPEAERVAPGAPRKKARAEPLPHGSSVAKMNAGCARKSAPVYVCTLGSATKSASAFNLACE